MLHHKFPGLVKLDRRKVQHSKLELADDVVDGTQTMVLFNHLADILTSP